MNIPGKFDTRYTSKHTTFYPHKVQSVVKDVSVAVMIGAPK